LWLVPRSDQISFGPPDDPPFVSFADSVPCAACVELNVTELPPLMSTVDHGVGVPSAWLDVIAAPLLPVSKFADPFWNASHSIETSSPT